MSRLAAGVLALLSISCGGASDAPEVVVDWLAPGRLLNALPASVELRPAELLGPANRGFVGRVENDEDGEETLWSAEHRARIQLELLDAPARWLHLDVRTPTAEPVEVTVVWDGETAERLRWRGRASHRIALPGSTQGAVHRLDLYVDRLRSPADDPRQLAFAIYGLRIESDVAQHGVWRWMPRDVPSELRLARPAMDEPSALRILESNDGESWQLLRHIDVAAGEAPDVVLRLESTERALPSRIAVVGSSAWTVLRQTSWPRRPLDRRDLLLVSLDTTRRDALGVYRRHDPQPAALGIDESPTPHLDAWAARARVYDTALSPAPVTAPTHASLFLSQPPAEHGLVNNGQSMPFADAENLTALLQAWGYESAGFVSLGVLGGDAGFAQNFSHFDDALGENWSRPAAGVNAALDHWLAMERADAPSFVWLHYSDPHFPYGDVDDGGGVLLDLGSGEPISLPRNGSARRFSMSAPPGRHRLVLRAPGDQAASDSRQYRVLRLRSSDERVELKTDEGFVLRDGAFTMGVEAELALSVGGDSPASFAIEIGVEEIVGDLERRRNYAADVRRMDSAIEAAWASLRTAGWGEDAIVWVFGDHGEDLGLEDGRFGHVQHVRPTLSRIPLFVVDPRLAAGRVAEPVGVVDMAPSVAASVGLTPLPTWRGEDLLDGVQGGRPLHLESFPPESAEHWRALVRDGYKLEGRLDATREPPSTLHIFDLHADPDCRVDLSPGGDGAPTGERRRALVTEWGAWTGESGGPEQPDAGMVERLRALGYLD